MYTEVNHNLKVALVHDYIKEYGGAERVLEALHELFPDAPVYTSVYLPKFLGPHRARFANWDIRTSWLQYVPFRHKLISPFRLLSPWVFHQFDLSDYDVVIVSATGAYFPNTVQAKPEVNSYAKAGAMHICYCHTPPRYLYGYATARDWKKHKILAVLGGFANHILRMIDFEASKNVDYYIANSEEVAARIRKFYRVGAEVIYPPVKVESLGESIQGLEKKKMQTRPSRLNPKPYFLTGGRLARAKHVDLIVQACAKLGVPLKVFGRGFAGYEEELKSHISNSSNPSLTAKRWQSKVWGVGGKMAVASTVEFLGEISDEQKYKLMQNAKAFIFAGEDEDFGILPAEAMSAGLPVIAYRSGGVQETVIDGKTGVFFDELSIASLADAINRFDKMEFNSKDCRKRAEQFSRQAFLEHLRQFVAEKIRKRN